MFDNVAKARDAGVSLAFLSGNSISGVVELLPGSDGRPNRVMRRSGRAFDAEQELMGGTSYGVGFTDWTCDKPEHWVFEGTNMKKGDRVAQLVGWEYHGPPLGKHRGPGRALGRAGVRRRRREAHRDVCDDDVHGRRRATWSSTRRPAGGTWCSRRRPGFQNPPRKDFSRATIPHPANHEECPRPDDQDHRSPTDRHRTESEDVLK